jgi:hypothetical protein
MNVLDPYILVVSLSMRSADSMLQHDTLQTAAIHNPIVRFALERATKGAGKRLEGSKCRQVLSDFRDPSGHTIEENLTLLDETPRSYLSRITFREGRDDRCRNRATLAFTNVHGREVFICAPQFWQVYQTDPVHVEVLLIHEMLHTLGLGENPPSSVQINERVRKRCG